MRRTFMRRLCFVFYLLTVLSVAMAQNCGQRDTIIFTANTSTSIELEISEYFNNDLSDPLQGLCEIELDFVHQFVENFELSLTSPAGQTVNLLGPNSDDPLAFTPGTQWNISLVNCAATAMPDSAFAAQWDNEQTENWVPFTTYTGSYYPFGGCLEDFNTGPVNGTWTFNITNDPSNNPGAITYIRLIFCDSRGVECCFAAAGEWQNEDIRSCVNADTLLIEPEILFPLGPADTTEYAYAFLIGESGIYQQLDSTIDLRTAPPGEYEICGFSYRRSQLDSLPLPDGLLTLDSIRTNLEGLEPWLCAELTPNCLQVSIQAPPDTTRLDERICRGDSIQIGQEVFRDGGFYTVDLLNEVGCDSIVTLDLFVQEVQFVSLDTTICPGDSVFVGNTPYFETGIYQDTLPTVELGCDSIITLDLTVLSQQLTMLSPVICAGDTFTVGDSTLTTSGQYQILLTSVAGCDSLVSVDLEVLNPSATISGPDLINCAMPEAVLDAANSLPAGQLTFQWFDPAEMLLGSSPTYTVTSAGTYILEVAQEQDGTVCLARDTMLVMGNFATPIADPGLPELLTCINDTISIGGPTTSTGPAYTYLWQTSNGNISGPTDEVTTQVTTAGQYELIVTDTFSFCRDTALIDVSADQIPPAVITGDSFTLNCAVTADTLDGSASFQTGFTLQWSGPCILEEPGNGLAVVDCPGWYFLEVTNTATGCVAIDSVLVDQDLDPALAQIVAPDTLTCAVTNLTLDASPSMPNGNLDFSWLGPNGENGNTATLTIDSGGEYQVIVSRQDNFCRDTTTVMVVQDTLSPIADAGLPDTLTCAQDELTLGGPATSNGPLYSYTWYQNDNEIPGENDDTLRVNAAATYILEVTNLSNNCSTQDSVIISEDFIPPEEVEAGPNQLLNCGGDIVVLEPDSTSFSRPVRWEWTADCIEPYSETWALATDCPGLYTLTVTNLDNGCQGSDTVRVNVAPNFSQAILPDTAYLSCESGEATLDNSGSTGTLFSWFRDGINISLPNNQPVVNQTGVYTLITSDLSMTCQDTASVEVIFDCQPTALIATPNTLTCARQSVVLSGLGSQTFGVNSYRWEGPNASCFITPSNQEEVEVVCAGEYQLIVEHLLFGQADTTTVTVLIDTVAPQVYAGENIQITCLNPTANLMGEVLNSTAPMTYAWTNFVPGDTLAQTLDFSTQLPGTYLFFARNSENGCIGSDLVQVTLNNSPPIIAFGSDVYPCEADSFLLQAFVSPAGDYQYTWTGTDILSTTDSSDVWIGGPGSYFLEVFTTTTGCSNIDSITVQEQTCIPCLELPASDTLDCQTSMVTLDAAFCRQCIDCTLQWSDVDGPINGEESLSLTIGSPGTYTLTATDTLGFSSSVSAEVLLLDTPPLLSLGSDRVLTCDSTMLSLSNTLTNAPAVPLTYEWFEMDDGPLSLAPAITVDEAGTYILVLTDTQTGCDARDTLVVTENQVPPTAEAGPDQELTCQSNVIVLDGSDSSLSNVSFSWTGPNSACLTGANTNSPLATCPGLYTLVVTNNDNGCSAEDTVRVLINEDVPELQPFPDTVLTCANPSITLSSMPPAGGTFSTQWCPLDESGDVISAACAIGQTDTLISQAGQYEFTVVNTQTGCSNSFVVSVTMDTLPPLIDAGITDTLKCNANSLMLDATVPANTSMTWTGPSEATILDGDTSTPIIDAVGWYFLEVTDNNNGCTSIDSVQIVEDENSPTLDAGLDTLINCFEPTIRLNAIGATSNGAANWAWTTDDGQIEADADQPNPLISSAGMYIVTLSDTGNGCSVMDTVLVSEDFRAPTATLLAPQGLTITCVLDTLLLTGTTSFSDTGAPLSYSWSAVPPGNLFPDLAADTVYTDRPGLYELIVTDQLNGCRDSVTFNIIADQSDPELTLQTPEPIDCQTANAELAVVIPADPTGFSFSWTNAAGEIIATTPTATATEAGWYFLSLTEDNNGCTNLDSVLVVLDDDFPEVVIAPPLTLSCSRLSVDLDGSGSSFGNSISYQWSTADGTLLGTGTGLIDSAGSIGTYVLTVNNALNGCSSSDSVTVAQDGLPIAGIETDLASPPCEGSPFGSISIDAVIGGTPPYLYQIDEDAPGAQSFFEDLLPGSYTLTVIDDNGCRWTETVALTNPQALDLDLGLDLALTLGDSAQLKPLTNRPIDTWQWDAPGLLAADAEYEPTVTPLSTQFVVLTVFDDNGCSASDTILIFVDKDRDIFIPTAFSPDENGNNDRFTLYAGDEVVLVKSLRIFSRWGNMVYENQNFAPNDPNLGWDGTLWGEPLNAAVFVYYAEILYADGKTEFITGDVLLMR